jgi:hypothetical protein
MFTIITSIKFEKKMIQHTLLYAFKSYRGLAFMLLIFIVLFSCSKSDSEPETIKNIDIDGLFDKIWELKSETFLTDAGTKYINPYNKGCAFFIQFYENNTFEQSWYDNNCNPVKYSGTWLKNDNYFILKGFNISPNNAYDPNYSETFFMARTFKSTLTLGYYPNGEGNIKEIQYDFEITDKIPQPIINVLLEILGNNKMQVEWNKSELSNDFSHYQVYVKNYLSNEVISGNEYFQEIVLATIENIDQTTVELDIPFMINPVMGVRQVNKEVLKSPETSNNPKVLEYKSPMVLEMRQIHDIKLDPNETFLYFTGSGKHCCASPKHGSLNLNSFVHTYKENLFLTLVESSFGLEFWEFNTDYINLFNTKTIVQFGTLNWNLATNPNDYFSSPFELENKIWLTANNSGIYSLKRTETGFEVLNTQPHYDYHTPYPPYILEINDNKVLLGHPEIEKSILYTIDANGAFSDKQFIDFRFKSDMIHSKKSGYILDILDKILYETDSFMLVKNMVDNFYPICFSNDGQYIYGTSNNIYKSLDEIPDEEMTRTLFIYNINTGEIRSKETIGYPHKIVQSINGVIYCVSSYFKSTYAFSRSAKDHYDLFIEEIRLD